MTKIYEMCFLGNIPTNAGRRAKFKITQILEFNLPKMQIPISNPYLHFKKSPIKDLEIGDYLVATTEDDVSFKEWKRTLTPDRPLSLDEIFQYVVEEKAKKMEKQALIEFRYDKVRLDRILKRVKDAMLELTPSQRSAFALYVYQYLLKK